jgi:hypothetical protein
VRVSGDFSPERQALELAEIEKKRGVQTTFPRLHDYFNHRMLRLEGPGASGSSRPGGRDNRSIAKKWAISAELSEK